MASFKTKKNVIDTFARGDDYVPTPSQDIVKYVKGRGNNLHEVENTKGETLLVSMPKKFRALVWLRPSNTVVVEYITEGKKVVGEIFCRLDTKHVVNLIKKEMWPHLPDYDLTMSRQEMMEFFQKPVLRKGEKPVLIRDVVEDEDPTGENIDLSGYDSQCTTESDTYQSEDEDGDSLKEDEDGGDLEEDEDGGGLEEDEHGGGFEEDEDGGRLEEDEEKEEADDTIMEVDPKQQ